MQRQQHKRVRGELTRGAAIGEVALTWKSILSVFRNRRIGPRAGVRIGGGVRGWTWEARPGSRNKSGSRSGDGGGCISAASGRVAATAGLTRCAAAAAAVHTATVGQSKIDANF